MSDILDLLDVPDDDRGPSLAELDDAALQAHITAVAERRDELAESEPVKADLLNQILVGLVVERDRRAELAVRVDDAISEAAGVRGVSTRLLLTPRQRRDMRRGGDGR